MDSHNAGARGGEGAGLWEWNLTSNRIHYSPRWVALVGCEDHEIGNAPDEWLRRVHPEDLESLTATLDAVRAGTTPQFDVRHRLRHKDGTYRWTSCRGGVLPGTEGPPVRMMGSHSNITVDTAADALTGLPNRLLLLDRLGRSIARAHQQDGFHYALLVLDLGRPSPTLAAGRSAGRDPLLTSAARRLETHVRTGGTALGVTYHGLVARLQDDQFAVLLDGLKEITHAKLVADGILEQFLTPFALNGGEVFLSTSIGVAISATGYQRADDVLRDAETALHRAQVLGGSHCEVFDVAVLTSAHAAQQLEDELGGALERDEFRLVYQPIVSLASNQIVGFEALMRWQHPVLGVVSPAEFMATAERNGSIVPLGHWVIRTACAQLKTWHDTLPDSAHLWVSINISSVQLATPALIDHVGDTLRDSGLDPHCVVLELTEGIAMENPTAVKSLLMRLRAMGVRISIDDFGTGYSSLSHLRQFPVDALKVDRSFVRGMETHSDMAEIVATMTAMSQQLGLHIVAEGIENEQQAALLRSLHCDSAQGYFFAEPLDADRATVLLAEGLPRSTGEVPLVAAEASEEPPQSVPPVESASLPSFPARWMAFATVLLAVASIGVLRVGQRPSAVDRPEVSSAAPIPDAPARSAGAGSGNPAAPGDAAVTPRPAPPAPGAVQPAGRRSSSPARVPDRPKVAPPVPSRSTQVVHLHRVGQCEGRLVVSSDAVAFVPDDTNENDAFTFFYRDFLQTLDGDTLIIRTSSRTYRFKAPGPDGRGADRAQIQGLVEQIASFR